MFTFWESLISTNICLQGKKIIIFLVSVIFLVREGYVEGEGERETYSLP